MYRHPSDALNEVLELNPSLLIVHKEAEVDFPTLAVSLKSAGIRPGIAILQDTPVDSILDELEYAEHVLIFAGDLGHFGGQADLALLKKVEQLKKYKPEIEVGWDGGANSENVKILASGGVDVINVGGFIQNASDPVAAYRELTDLL